MVNRGYENFHLVIRNVYFYHQFFKMYILSLVISGKTRGLLTHIETSTTIGFLLCHVDLSLRPPENLKIKGNWRYVQLSSLIMRQLQIIANMIYDQITKQKNFCPGSPYFSSLYAPDKIGYISDMSRFSA